MSFKPETRAEQFVHLIACLILDTGARIDEVLSLERQDVDLDNLLLTIRVGSEGRKGASCTSLQMRKLLFRFMHREKSERQIRTVLLASGQMGGQRQTDDGGATLGGSRSRGKNADRKKCLHGGLDCDTLTPGWVRSGFAVTLGFPSDAARARPSTSTAL